MKKLVMAMAIALATVAAQAEIMPIHVTGIYSPGTYDGISANGYLMYWDTLNMIDAVAAFNLEGASSYESTIASSAAQKVIIAGGEWQGSADVSSSGMYVLCFDQDNMYVSYPGQVATPVGGGADVFVIDGFTTSSTAAMSASSFNGAGWYTAVPEPTSGLLMLLGVAGLALKRKRA